MNYHDIANLLNRNERTIWTAYNKSKQKQPEPISIKETEIKLTLSISIFKNENLTPLESIAINLKQKQNLNYKQIADLLNRDQRNIWTIYSNAIKKH